MKGSRPGDTLNAAFGIKIFTRSGERLLKYSVNAEALARRKIPAGQLLFASVYLESIYTDYDSSIHGFYLSHSGAPLLYRIANLGLEFPYTNGAAFQVYLAYSHSNGRGIDFVEEIEGWGLGIRYIPPK